MSYRHRETIVFGYVGLVKWKVAQLTEDLPFDRSPDAASELMAYELTCIWTNGKWRNFSWIVLCSFICMNGAPLVAQMVKNLPAMWETWVRSLDQQDPLEKGMATYSSVLAWRIPWTEEPGGLQSMGSQRVGHDWATNTHTQLINTHTHTSVWVFQISSLIKQKECNTTFGTVLNATNAAATLVKYNTGCRTSMKKVSVSSGPLFFLPA